MLTVKNTLNQITDTKRIMQELRETLKKIDPMYQEEENKFLQALACLVKEMERLEYSNVEEYLAAKEEVFAMELIYIGWQGFLLNLEIFKNPVTALMLREDYEELHLERRLSTLSTVMEAQKNLSAFCTTFGLLSEDKRLLTQVIDDYYSYLQTTGYKLAHYFGFRLADQFLPYVIPGYVSDPVHTLRYSSSLANNLQINLKQLE